MHTLDALLEELVLPHDGNSLPDINGLVAGFTDSKRTKYLAAKGVKRFDKMDPVTTDTRLAFFSCTKTITAMAVLQLYEKGQIDLDAPAKKYLPMIGEIGLIDPGQVDDDTGEFIKPPRKPKNDVTVRHLLLHTAGFAYVFTDPDYFNIVMNKHREHTGAIPSLRMFSTDVMPLVFEPGTLWRYGHSLDWLGLVVEAVTGMKFSQYLQKNIFDPAGLSSFTFRIDNEDQLIPISMRKDDGTLRVLRKKPVPHQPSIDMGGQGCFGTVGDFLQFMRIWLNKGLCVETGAQILKKETVEYAIQAHLPEGIHVELDTAMTGEAPSDFLPDNFTLTGCAYNMNNLPTGRPRGSIYWAGLASLYFWIDFENDVAGFYGCQILPYLDSPCLVGYIRYENAVYDMLRKEREAIKGKL